MPRWLPPLPSPAPSSSPFVTEEFDLVYDEADRLLTKVRDEAHRFANYYRKQQERLAFKKAQEGL